MWTPTTEEAFEKLNLALISTPVLASPGFTKGFTIECDSSNIGIGIVLSQLRHPITFMSKVLGQRHLALSVYDKEMMVVVFAVQIGGLIFLDTISTSSLIIGPLNTSSSSELPHHLNKNG